MPNINTLDCIVTYLKGYLALFSLLLSVHTLAQGESVIDLTSGQDSLMKRTSIGAGIGGAYGFAGLNIGYRYSQYAKVILGSGYRGATVGGYWYPSDTWQTLRLSAIYGPNSLLDACSDSRNCKLKEKVYSGVMLGLGMGPQYENGWEFDLLYVATNGDYDKDYEEAKRKGLYSGASKESPVRLSLGYRWTKN